MINGQVTANGNPPECTEDPIDSASAHWNSEASVVARKSRWRNEKALLFYRFPSRVHGPKVRRSNLRNTVEIAKRVEGGAKERYPLTSRLGTSWCTADTYTWTGKLCSNKVERVPGTLISLRFAKRVCPAQSYAVCRSVIGDVSATGRTSRKYSRVPEREMNNIFQTRPTDTHRYDPRIWDSRTIYWVCIMGSSSARDRRLILVRETGLWYVIARVSSERISLSPSFPPSSLLLSHPLCDAAKSLLLHLPDRLKFT